jgi:hypothetical protein
MRVVIKLLFLAIAVVLLVCLSASNRAEAQTASLVPARQADVFVDSIGVDTNLGQAGTNYTLAWPAALEDLESLGIRHIRDRYSNWAPGTPLFTKHRQLASAGIHTDYVMPHSKSFTAAAVKKLAQQAGDMESIEAPNECDVAKYCGAQGMANMISLLPTMVASGKAANVPVFGPSFALFKTYSLVGNISPYVTHSNLHIYFGGRNPGSSGWGGRDAEGNRYGSFAFWLDRAHESAPSKPVVITETGYMMLPQPKPFTIPPSTGASYIPRTLLLAFMHGIKRTYLFELLDEYSARGYGLIDENMNPKPAYYAVQKLIATLRDPGPRFTPGKLAYSLNGGGPTLKQILFQKRNGTFWLVLWLEEGSYDQVNLKETPVDARKVTLQISGKYRATNVGTIEDNGDLNWTSAKPAGLSKTIRVSDSVTIVKIVPGN